MVTSIPKYFAAKIAADEKKYAPARLTYAMLNVLEHSAEVKPFDKMSKEELTAAAIGLIDAAGLTVIGNGLTSESFADKLKQDATAFKELEGTEESQARGDREKYKTLRDQFYNAVSAQGEDFLQAISYNVASEIKAVEVSNPWLKALASSANPKVEKQVAKQNVVDRKRGELSYSQDGRFAHLSDKELGDLVGFTVEPEDFKREGLSTKQIMINNTVEKLSGEKRAGIITDETLQRATTLFDEISGRLEGRVVQHVSEEPKPGIFAKIVTAFSPKRAGMAAKIHQTSDASSYSSQSISEDSATTSIDNPLHKETCTPASKPRTAVGNPSAAKLSRSTHISAGISI